MKHYAITLVTLLSLLIPLKSWGLDNTWKSSCNSDYSNPNKGTYIFHVKKGEVGGCPSDKLKQEYGGYGWDWSERAEVKTKSN